MVKNLLYAQHIPESRFNNGSRILNLPGSTVTVQEMLEALKGVGGDDAVRLVEERKDLAIEKIVEGWPARLDTARAEELGFSKDGSLTQAIEAYLEDYGRGTAS